MKKSLLLILIIGLTAISCATVEVKAPKDPIKMDIAMRLDVYQHVAKDIDDIENMVAGKKDTAWVENFFIQDAYAADLSPEAMQAIERRKARHAEVINLLSQGAVGEGKNGLLSVRGSEGTDVVNAENQDRLVIYNALAQKNGSSVADVQKISGERHQKNAPAGSPIETDSGWVKK